MSLEDRLLGKLTDAYSIQTIVKRGVSQELLMIPSNREILKFGIDYYARYGKPPTPLILKERFNVELYDNGQEPIEAIIDELNIRYRRNEIEQTLYKAAEKLKDDPNDSLQYLSRKTYEIFLNTKDKSQTYDYIQSVDQRISEYYQRTKRGESITGCPTGWTHYDWHTLGLDRGELGVLFAATGDGKTYTMLRMALGAYAFGWTPLIIAYEPTIPNLSMRLDSLVARVNPRRYRLGKLTEEEYQQFYSRMNKLKKYTMPFVITKPVHNDVAGIVESLREHNYQSSDKWVVFIDQLSFMESKGDKQEYYRNLFNEIMKTISPSNLNVPCWLLAQENREGMKARQTKLFHIALSSAAEQFADIVINLDRDEVGGTILRILKNRNGPRAEFTMDFNLERGIIEIVGYNDPSRMGFQRE